MTLVTDLDTEKQQAFSLLPKQAVIAAYEQGRNNWSTWTYNYEDHPEFRETTWYVSCGRFTARK